MGFFDNDNMSWADFDGSGDVDSAENYLGLEILEDDGNDRDDMDLDYDSDDLDYDSDYVDDPDDMDLDDYNEIESDDFPLSASTSDGALKRQPKISGLAGTYSLMTFPFSSFSLCTS